jgi:hypothetical protein
MSPAQTSLCWVFGRDASVDALGRHLGNTGRPPAHWPPPEVLKYDCLPPPSNPVASTFFPTYVCFTLFIYTPLSLTQVSLIVYLSSLIPSGRMTTKETPAQCADCGAILSRPSDVKRHRRTQHPTGAEVKYVGDMMPNSLITNCLSNRFRCPEPGCSYMADQKSNLNAHLKAIQFAVFISRLLLN